MGQQTKNNQYTTYPINYSSNCNDTSMEQNNNIAQLTKDILPVVPIPTDFLRIPVVVAAPRPSSYTYEVTLRKDSVVGLGMTIRDTEIGDVPVTNLDFRNSPARLAGVKVGDVLKSVNGQAIGTVRRAAELIRFSSAPPKLEFVRSTASPNNNQNVQLGGNDSNLYSTLSPNTQLDYNNSTNIYENSHPHQRWRAYPGSKAGVVSAHYGNQPRHNVPSQVDQYTIHPILEVLRRKKLLLSEHSTQENLLRYSAALRHHALHGHAITYTRMALCIRILHSFDDPERKDVAYTIWVHDVSSGKEWYAPARYYRDFAELKFNATKLCSKINDFPIEKEGLKLFQRNDDNKNAAERLLLLESFLRNVCVMLFSTNSTSTRLAEVAVHLRSFLGCDEEASKSSTSRYEQFISQSDKFTMNLRRSIQLYVYQLFTLPPFERVVSQFVAENKKRASEVFKIVETGKKNTKWLKVVSEKELGKVQGCLNQLHQMIMEGCRNDLRSIADIHSVDIDFSDAIAESVHEQVELEVYVPLRSVLSKMLVNGYQHDDIETQFKIKELRGRPQSFFRIKEEHQSPSDWGSVSKIIQDGVVKSALPCTKLQAIVAAAKEINRLFISEHSLPQPQDASLSDAEVLVEGLSISEAKAESPEDRPTLGADEFLPIFIFCVTRSEIERPCALCALLEKLCSPSKQMGETGYYLASFTAAIAHIRELDLTDGNCPPPLI